MNLLRFFNDLGEDLTGKKKIYKSVLITPDAIEHITDTNKEIVMDWMHDKMIEHGINWKSNETLLKPKKNDPIVKLWEKGEISLICNFKI